MSQANQLEQLMLDLINQERTDLNLQPLRFNGDLNEASEDHSQWMLDTGNFSHTGANGSSAGDRIVDAGYELEGNWTWGENIGWQSERGEPGLEDDVRDVHESLMNSPGHRANILNPEYDEIGIGIEQGDFDSFDSVMVTQNFGATDATPDPDSPEEEEETPVAEGPTDETPTNDDTPVTDDPTDETPEEEETPVAEGPDAEETPDVDDPVEDIPDEEETPVAEDPTDEDPEEEETPVAEGPTDETPEEEDTPETEDPDDDEEETPVAEGPTDETPDEEETPDTEEPDQEAFDVENFLAELNEMLEDLFDSFDFVAFDPSDCEVIDVTDDMPITDTDSEMDMPDAMETDCGDWAVDQIEFNVSIDISYNFDLA